MRSIEEILRICLGPDCQAKVTQSIAIENRIRVADLWSHFPAELRGESLPTVETVRTVRAFPHTRVTRDGLYLIVDQQMVHIFGILTWHLMAASSSSRVLVEGQRLFAERLAAAGFTDSAFLLHRYCELREQEDGPPQELTRGAYEQGDLLARGQWMFTLAHEMVHGMLNVGHATPELHSEVDRRVRSAAGELEEALHVLLFCRRQEISMTDDLRLLPVLYVAHLLQGGGVFESGTPEFLNIIADQLKLMVAHIQDAQLRVEITCDLVAAMAVCRVLERYTMRRITLAACLMALGSLTLLQLLDDAVQSEGSRPPARFNAALRLLVLRGAFTSTASNLFVTPEDRVLASRAIGGLMIAYGETYEVLFRCDWASLLAGLRATDPSP